MMEKKKLLVLAPILTFPEDLGPFLSALAFLEPNYELHGVDPLLTLSDLSNAVYYEHWIQTLSRTMHQYDALMGFSFGGVILQQCFSLFHTDHKAKPILLFSVPSFADKSLIEKLTRVLRLVKSNQLDAANQLKMTYVLHPQLNTEIKTTSQSHALGSARLVEGIARILNTDSRVILQTHPVKYHHFIGEHSYLVNQKNVMVGQAGNLITVPGAGMRVLQDNGYFCYPKIKEILL